MQAQARQPLADAAAVNTTRWALYRRGPWAPRGAYVITKLLLIASLALAIALNLRLFFLILVAPLFVAYFLVYGLFSWIVFRRSGIPLIGALANSVIFAWIVAVTFPLVR